MGTRDGDDGNERRHGHEIGRMRRMSRMNQDGVM